MKKFNLITLFLLFSLIISPIANAQSAYDYNPAIKSQTFLDQIQQSLQSSSGEAFTAAGEQLQCSVKPTAYGTSQASGFIPTGQFQDITCGGGEALVNWYHIYSTGTWDFQGELRVSPALNIPSVRLNANGGYPIGWECYRCEKISAQCTSGQSRCYSYNSIQTCVNGKWSSEQICPTKQLCTLQGKCSSTCEEKVLSTDWSACVNNKQIRTTYDARACGTFQSKTETQACTSPVPTPVVVPPVQKAIGISINQIGVLTDEDLKKSLCNNNLECSTGQCVDASAVGLAAIFSTEAVNQLYEDIKNLFGDSVVTRVENNVQASGKSGICLTDYTPGITISSKCSTGFVLENDKCVALAAGTETSQGETTPLLNEELEDTARQPTQGEIKSALCARDTECKEKVGYEVLCMAKNGFEEKYDLDVPSLSAIEQITLGKNINEDNVGVCVATLEGENSFLNFFASIGKSVGAKGSNAGAIGAAIVIGGILLLFMLFSGGRRN